MSKSALNRRALLRAGLALGMVSLGSALTTACSRTEGPIVTSPRDSTTSSATPNRHVLLAFFSRAGENYRYGGRVDLKVGNTQVLAGLIEEHAEVDVFPITAADPYPHGYDETVARNVREEKADARPAIAGTLPSLTGYDTVLLGSPVWNVQEPMIMRTFIDALDWTGKAVHPFVTYAVSGMGNVQENYVELIPDAMVSDGLAVQGEKVHGSLPQVKAWLTRIGLA